MTLVEDFDGFYDATAQRTLHVIYAMCGDRKVALESTVDAYRHAARDWKKLRSANPQEFVRNDAWHFTSLNRTTHPMRRSDEDDSDIALLNALRELDVNSRRLLVLLTLGDTDLDQAAREVQVTPEEGIELATEALAFLEKALNEGIEGVESRLNALGEVTDTMVMPPVDQIRQQARSHRVRNSIIMIAAAILAVTGLGFALTEGNPRDTATELPSRQKIGNETEDQTLVAAAFDADLLISPAQLRAMDPSVNWKLLATEEDVDGDMPYATCPTERFANKDPLRTFVRTYEGKGEVRNRLAQAVEISRSRDDAAAAYEDMVAWFAECQHPRTQLVDAYTVEQPTGTFDIMRLRSHRDTVRTFTVGMSRSGTLALALVHETDGKDGPDIQAFARTLNNSLYKLCRRSGGECSTEFEVQKAPPPQAKDAPAFLSIVDLPAVADVDSVWSATEPETMEKNPADTVCEATRFDDEKSAQATSRVFLMPEAQKIPQRFGLAQTVATFESEKAAKKFVKQATSRFSKCPDSKLAVKILDTSKVSVGDSKGVVWQLDYEVSKGNKASIRTGLIQHGSTVSQVTLTPVGKYDVSQKQFVSLMKRAGERLGYAETDTK